MLTEKEIIAEVEKAGYKLVSSEGYKNLSSLIEVECGKGHIRKESISNLRMSSVCFQCTREIANVNNYVPLKKGKRIVSIDQATQVAGVAIFDDGHLVYAADRKFTGTPNERYAQFARFLVQEVFNVWKPDEVIFEDIQYQNQIQTFKVLGGLLGICIVLAELQKIPYHIYLNKTWQSSFYIKGKNRQEQKQNTIKKVEELFGIKVSDDIADSVLLGYHHIVKNSSKF